MSELYLGLISGTSMDGVDAAVVEFPPDDADNSCRIVAADCYPYHAELQQALHRAVEAPETCDVDTVGRLDALVGGAFAAAAMRLMRQASLETADIAAIGSHGQTLRHRPEGATPFTLQLGDPNIIVARTGITAVADFRRRDMALGGEGAPLAPAFHRWLLYSAEESRAVLNLGGIANLTLLPVAGKAAGFDTGPGNTLLDAWTRRHRGEPWDADGEFAAEGEVSDLLLAACLDDPYFVAAPPKSTGPEHFNPHWLETRLEALPSQPAPADVQATLAELTVESVHRAVSVSLPSARRVVVCGGGAHNRYLMRRLETLFDPVEVTTSEEFGLAPDWVEAAAFAWLARETLAGRPGNLPAVTGAGTRAILGGIYPA